MNDYLPLFDLPASIEARDVGMAKAADSKRSLLELARHVAVELADRNGTVTADDVYEYLIARGMKERALGNAAGSIFMGGQFEWTGRFHKSTRVIGHGNLQRIWRLRG